MIRLMERSMTHDLKVYLASPYGQRGDMARVARELKERFGFVLTSRWVWNGEETPEHPAEYWAAVDLDDLLAADILIIFPDAETGRGHHIEFGYALGTGKRIIVIGQRPSIFYHLPELEWFPDIESFYAEIADE